MIQDETLDLHPKESGSGLKMKGYRKIRVNLYLTEAELAEYTEEASKVGLRPKQAKLFTQKPHGFAHEQVPNTKGIAKLIRKFIFPAWKKAEAERLMKKRELEKQAKELGITLGD